MNRGLRVKGLNFLLPRPQRGMALVTAMLLLMIITILALSMFRSFGTQSKVGGNVREKERALHAAESAQQFAETWLLTGPNLNAAPIACAGNGGAPVNSNNGSAAQICAETIAQMLQPQGQTAANAPWQLTGGGGGYLGFSFLPTGMSTNAGGGWTGNQQDYYAPPVFYVADLGAAMDGQGEAYQIDAYGYGGTANAVAVVESVYEVHKGVICFSCN
jgi:type IV pilus assembly protein PilX